MIRCINCKGSHKLLEGFERCFDSSEFAFPVFEPVTDSPSPSQIDYAHKLLRERIPIGIVGEVEKMLGEEAACEMVNAMTSSMMGSFIYAMKFTGKPRPLPQNVQSPIVGVGVYERRGLTYEVRAAHSDRHLYGCVLVPALRGPYRWMILPGAVHQLR
jgi:hypothetical protein